MLADYWPILVLLGISTFVTIAMTVLGTLFGPKRPSDVKAAPYESGMRPIGPGTRRMPIRFYIVAVLFILFDIEVIFLLPWAVVFKEFVNNGWGVFALVEIFIFLIILLVGYVYAWKKGALEWD